MKPWISFKNSSKIRHFFNIREWLSDECKFQGKMLGSMRIYDFHIQLVKKAFNSCASGYGKQNLDIKYRQARVTYAYKKLVF